MAGKGFSYPVLFGDEKSDIRATVERRMRYIGSFINAYIATYDTDTRDLRIRDNGGVVAGTGFTESDPLHLTTKTYVDNAVSGAGGGGGTILAANYVTHSSVSVSGSTETDYALTTLTGFSASATVYVDLTITWGPATGGYYYMLSGVRPTVNGTRYGASFNQYVNGAVRIFVAETADSSGNITLETAIKSAGTYTVDIQYAYGIYSR